eukprot:Gregarina_sp_Poly_1__5668@NODE_2991_length_1471_cov_100_013533_g1892_i0_p1_GENE_NODE_2991_length_1471_cov_100_013533_g1892_i0NODE_2991_length_1471_cov_100_013533_g1892_i0_p1_ORF_typecomplete_len250_score49_09DNA_pol_phi/PF04931_13/5_9_NODE_2991_length_1471_cov_100_013533_g1892_i057806
MNCIALEEVLASGLKSANKLESKKFKPEDNAACINNIYTAFIGNFILSAAGNDSPDSRTSTSLTVEGKPLATRTIDTELAGLFQKKNILYQNINERSLKKVLIDVEKQSYAVSTQLRRAVKQVRGNDKKFLEFFIEDADANENESKSSDNENNDDGNVATSANHNDESDEESLNNSADDGAGNESELNLLNAKDAKTLDDQLGAEMTKEELDMLYGDIDLNDEDDSEDDDDFFGIRRQVSKSVAGKKNT